MLRWLAVPALLAFASLLPAQDPGTALPASDAKHNGTEKMHMLAHVVAHPGAWKAADIELEQDRDRPYVYLCGFVNFDVQIYDIRNTSAPKKIYEWTIENPELHRGIGAMDGKYFKIGKQVLLRAVVPVHAGEPRRRPGRGDLRRHRTCPTRAR